MLKGLIAAGLALCACSAAKAAILDFDYTFMDGKTVNGSFYGSMTNAAIFEVTGSRYFQRGFVGAYEGTTSVRSVASDKGRIALDKSLIDLNIQPVYSPNAASSTLFAVGNTPLRAGLQYDAAAFSNFAYEAFDPTRFNVTILQDATLDFTYRDPLSASTITGTLSGWISPDGSRFDVGGLTAINGMTPPAGLSTRSNYGQAPVILLDKSKLDVSFSSDPNNRYSGDFLVMNRGGLATIEYPGGLFGASNSLGGTGYFSDLRLANLTLRIGGTAAPVPEPASWTLLIAGFGAVGAAMRLRRKQTVTFA